MTSPVPASESAGLDLGRAGGPGVRRGLETLFFTLAALAWGTRIAVEGGAPAWTLNAAIGLAGTAAAAAVVFPRGSGVPRWLDGPRLVIALLALYCLPQVYGRLGGDGIQYYALLRSPLIDGDFDFANDYAGLGVKAFVSHEGVTTNRYPLGVPLFWLPTVALTHVALRGASLLGFRSVVADGFSPAYQAAATTTTFVLGVVALGLLERELRRRHGRAVALLAVLAVWLATPLDFYLTANPFMSHGASMVGATLLVLTWLHARRSRAPETWVFVGLAGAFTSLVRAQDTLLFILPLADIALGVPVARRAALFRLSIWPAILAILQLLAFLKIHGTGFVAALLGYALLDHPSPHPLEFLFAARHGFFTWTPLYLLAVPGLLLFPRGDRRAGLLSMLAFLTAVGLNSSMADWWGSDSFGQRRMLSLTPLFALGLGATLAWARRHPMAFPSAALAALALWNIQFSYIYNSEWLARKDQAVSLGQLAAAQSDVAARDVVRLADALPRTLFVLLYDNLKGLWLDEGPLSLGGVLTLNDNSLDFPVVGRGWSRPIKEGDTEFRYSKGRDSSLRFPVMTPGDFDVTLTIKAAFDAAPVAVRVEVGGQSIGEVALQTEWRDVSLFLPAHLVLPGVNDLTLRYSTTPADVVPDLAGRNAAVAVKSIRFARRSVR